MTARALWGAAAITAALTVISALVLDAPIARALAAYEPWPIWDAGISALEIPAGIAWWSYAPVVVLLGGALACAARPAWRRGLSAWIFVGGVYLTARVAMTWLKFGTGRLRPTEWFARGGGMWLRDGGFSFPSGHIALFAGLVIPLVVVAPRVGRPLLVAVAFAMIARMAVGAHFLSDVLGAIALCCACAALWAPMLGRAFR